MTKRDQDLIELMKEAAAKATPGPWRVFQTKHKRIDNQWHVGPGMHSVAHIPTWGSDEPRASNAAYIALCSPDNILSLIDRLSTLQSELDEARGALRAIVDTLDAEDMGEGPPAAEWTSHWQGLHERARAATRTAGGDGESDEHVCPICLVSFKPSDLCASDIELGICHAECLEGSPVVDLETGEPADGPVSTYRYSEVKP